MAIPVSKSIPISAIQSGDILVWKNTSTSTFSQFCLNVVKTLTNSPWGHVGVAVVMDDGLSRSVFVIEAILPKITISYVSPRDEVYCLQIEKPMTIKGKRFLLSTVGKTYSLGDAFRALMGWRLLRDDRWQCAELVHEYCDVEGIELPPEFKPSDIVRNLEDLRNTSISRVYWDDRARDGHSKEVK